jgi:outer membrane protein assembly factor BamB
MRKVAWVLVLGMAVAACDAGRTPEALPTQPSASEQSPEAGPCALGDEDAPCVFWRRTGFVAASSAGTVAVVAEADGVLKGLDTTSGDVLWETELDSEVAAIATIDDLAFVSVGDGVAAVAVDDGQEAWRHAGSLVDPGGDGIPAVFAGEGIVYGVAPDTGEELWSAEALSGAVGNAIGTDMVVISLESEIVAVSRTTGEERWRYASEMPIFASVVTADAVVASTASTGSEFDGYVILDADDGQLVNGRDDVTNALVIESEGHLVEVRFGQGASGIDAETGDYTWDIPLGNAFFVGARRFSLRDRALVMTADQNGVEVIAMIDPATGQQRWQVRGDAQLEQVTRGSRFLALTRLGGITLHDPATGEPVLALAVPNGVLLGDDPLVVYDGDAIVAVRTD